MQKKMRHAPSEGNAFRSARGGERCRAGSGRRARAACTAAHAPCACVAPQIT